MSEHRYMYPTVVELPRSTVRTRLQNDGATPQSQASPEDERHPRLLATIGMSNDIDVW